MCNLLGTSWKLSNSYTISLWKGSGSEWLSYMSGQSTSALSPSLSCVAAMAEEIDENTAGRAMMRCHQKRRQHGHGCQKVPMQTWLLIGSCRSSSSWGIDAISYFLLLTCQFNIVVKYGLSVDICISYAIWYMLKTLMISNAFNKFISTTYTNIRIMHGITCLVLCLNFLLHSMIGQ
jgi:hypothetical protein